MIQSISTIASNLVPTLVKPVVDGIRSVTQGFQFETRLNPFKSIAASVKNSDELDTQANPAIGDQTFDEQKLFDQLRSLLSLFGRPSDQLELGPDGFGGIQVTSVHDARVAVESTINGNPELVSRIYQYWNTPKFADVHELDRSITLRF